MPEERIILDPSELAEGRTEVDVTPWIGKEGVNWGDAEIEPYKARAQVGERVVDFSIPNRLITVPLAPQERGGTAFATIRSYIQAKAALGQREGLIGKRITPQGGTAYFDVVADGLTLSGGWLQAHKEVDNEAELRLEALPDFYEPEVKLTSAEEKSAPELIKVIEDLGGDMPARVRLVVEDKQGADQRTLIWAFRSRHYSEASTAKSAYEAEELQSLGAAAKGALEGASGGTAVSHTALPDFWTPVLGTNIGGTGFLTHAGTYRVYARLRSPDGTAVAARLVWDVGDLVNSEENDEWRFPGGSAFYVADLGEVRLDPAPVGAHRWQGQIQAKGTSGSEDINIDRVWIVNTDEGAGVLTAPPRLSVSSELLAWDNFDAHTAGTVAGKAAPLGGTWSEAGDTDDFTVDTENRWIQRTATSDSSLTTGQYLRLGTGAAATTDVSVDLYVVTPSAAGVLRRGVFARYTNPENCLFFVAEPTGENDPDLPPVFSMYRRVAGVLTTLASQQSSMKGWVTLRITIDKAGVANAYVYPQGSSTPIITLATTDTSLATGGTLDDGGYGVYDAYTAASALTRKYDNFRVGGESTMPISDAVIFASRKAQLTTDGMHRLDSGGSAYGPVSRVQGDIPRLPAGGMEGRLTELFLKGSRGDMEEVSDSAIDDIGVEVYGSRCWLTVPGAL